MQKIYRTIKKKKLKNINLEIKTLKSITPKKLLMHIL